MDLVHLGAKYAPCMRNDSNIYAAIQMDVDRERNSACCVRHDRGGCVQTDEKQCMKLISKWHKWHNESRNEGSTGLVSRSSGSVCGLDPMFCADTKIKDWIDDITQWPVRITLFKFDVLKFFLFLS